MSQTLVPTSVDVYDLRGAPAGSVAAPVLHDPTGRRARRLRRFSRGVMSLLGLWLVGLCLAGFGLLPGGMIPLGYLVSAPAPTPIMTLTGASSSVDGRPGAASAFGVALHLATGQRAPLAGPPVPVSFVRGGIANSPSVFGAPEYGTVGVGVAPTIVVDAPVSSDAPSTVGSNGPVRALPAPGTESPVVSDPVSAPPLGANSSPSSAAPAQGAASPGNSGAAPPRVDGASPGASGTAPGQTGDTPAAGNGNPSPGSSAGGNAPATSNAGGNAPVTSNAGGNDRGPAAGSNAGGNSANANAAADGNAGGNSKARGRASDTP